MAMPAPVISVEEGVGDDRRSPPIRGRTGLPGNSLAAFPNCYLPLELEPPELDDPPAPDLLDPALPLSEEPLFDCPDFFEPFCADSYSERLS